jgi:hypothetical protein
MTTAAFSLLRHAAENRERWLTRFYEIGKEAVRPRKKGELYAYVIPPSTHMSDLIRVLGIGDVEVDVAPPFTAGGVKFPDGTAVVRMAQPYGSFAKALLERQRYPDLRDSSGKPIAPYDVAAHTLPLLFGIEVREVHVPFRNKTYSGSVECKGWGDYPQHIAIYKSHIPSLDEGWTRFVLEEQWGEAVRDKGKPIYKPLLDAEARAGNLRAQYDTIIIPDQSPRAILEGYRKGTMPDELTGGLGTEGVRALREFVEAGGTLILLNRASDFAIEQFKLPLRDITADLKRAEFYVPGSILRVELDTSHPITRGMPKESIAWAEESPVFDLTDAKEAAARVRVIARYPETGDPLLSGWLLGGERIRGKAALVEVTLGKGRIYLFGFRPQYRGQSLATYPLLFNAISQSPRTQMSRREF